MLRLVRSDDQVKGVPADFTHIYEEWFDAVVRWIPAMGGNRADREDIAQEVFLIVERRLADFDGQNLGGWLYAVTLRTVRNHRRLAWFRHLLFRPSEDRVFDSQLSRDNPVQALEQKQLKQLAERVLATMGEKHRRAFVLFEFEEYSGEEIAELEKIPLATVWTRLHHARKEFVEGVKRQRAKEGL